MRWLLREADVRPARDSWETHAALEVLVCGIARIGDQPEYRSALLAEIDADIPSGGYHREVREGGGSEV
jgi:hypothetical protein